MEELLDLVDTNDNVTGQMSRSDVHAQGLNNYRVVNAFIVNSKGELWIPRRTAHKKRFALHLDVGMSGHVSSGETYDESFHRESSEELGIDIDAVPHRLLGHLSPADGVGCFMQVYEIQTDETPKYNTDDFVESFWISPQALLNRITGGDVAKNDLPTLVKMFYVK